MDRTEADALVKLESNDDPDESLEVDKINARDNYEKLKELVEKTTKMRLEAPERSRQAEDYIKMLRQKLDDSSAFLKTAKHNIENIKTLFQQDFIKNLNSQTYLDNIEKTDKEIEEEMKVVQQKLNELQGRICALKQGTNTQSRTFEEAVNDTINTLENMGNGVHNATNEA